MKISQKKWTLRGGWEQISREPTPHHPHLVLVFGSRPLLEDYSLIQEIMAWHKTNPVIVFCSTAGEIHNAGVAENSIIVTEIQFHKTTIKAAEIDFNGFTDSEQAGISLGEKIEHEHLKHVLIFTEGMEINGSAFVRGLQATMPTWVSITGGLAGDDTLIDHTVIGLNHAPETGKAVAVGFYGKYLKVGFGSFGGLDSFGPNMIATRTRENTLYEIDHKPALSIYKKLLGEKAAYLPGSGILFPINLRLQRLSGDNIEIARTLININEAEQSLIFTGDVPQGVGIRLMQANPDKLIQGAEKAATLSKIRLHQNEPELAILVSCIGRKLALKERIIEEVQSAHDTLGRDTIIAGFYSYGELCPATQTERLCQLHNQTMTITTFHES